jgi:type II secretory pathway pseudopilin PulG
MRRRSAFTLVEMMVSVALVLFIMVILTEAFGKGLDSFRTLKSLGDMDSRLRAAGEVIRRDLAMDHFEGKRRLSEDFETWQRNGAPREGVFTIMRTPNPNLIPVPEGTDAEGVGSQRAANWLIHFTAKARGNNRSEFFTATNLPTNTPLLSVPTTFFNQAADARFQEQPGGNRGLYSSQWAELAYYLEPNGQTESGVPLYTLNRCQYVMVADNSEVNWGRGRVRTAELRWNPGYAEMSCYDDQDVSLTAPSPYLHFCSPSETAQWRIGTAPLRTGQGAFTWTNRSRSATPVLTEVVSFDLTLLATMPASLPPAPTAPAPAPTPGADATVMVEIAPDWLSSLDRHLVVNKNTRIPVSVQALKITLRVHDKKTKLTRQMTLLQDL